jgi:multidrug efflux pump subunit AcrA (membrane-fusion protein)
MTIPDNTIISTDEGLKVIVVKPDHHLKYVPIKPGRNYGKEVEIQSGLTGNETLVENPTDFLRPNQLVKIGSGK